MLEEHNQNIALKIEGHGQMKWLWKRDKEIINNHNIVLFGRECSKKMTNFAVCASNAS